MRPSGTDRLHIAHNLIGRCRHSGYYLKPVSFRMQGAERGGTSRDARIINNIFYDCGEAAIVFPTRDNASEGNLFVRMQGGYLRVMYPEPECCLNLPAWREFFGFDLRGQNGWFDISLNEETGEISFSPASDTLPGKSLYVRRLNLVTDPEKIGRVPADPDLPGEGKDPVLPGPGDFRIR